MQRNPGSRQRGGRRYRYRRNRRRGALRLLLALALTGGCVFGAVRLVGYGIDHARARRTTGELQQIYYQSPAAQTPQPGLETPPPETAGAPGEDARTEAAATAVPAAPQALVPAYASKLPAAAYSAPPSAESQARFQALRQQNEDIVGWLTIDRLVDEPVVQRDNVFYLDHDAKGKSNDNGALFLDAIVSLKSRPYTLLIYGHNMRSGAMFGFFRHYDGLDFYHSHPFVTCDTLQEDGRYVIFAQGVISMQQDSPHYIDFFGLTVSDVRERQQALDALLACSAHTCEVDVNVRDQLLVLVTCVGDDDQRRVVAARRLREGETEEALLEQVKKSVKK